MADDSSDDAFEMQEYLGETKPRLMQVAVLTTLVCPGVGYMYIGRMVKGLTVNFLMVLMLEAFVIAWTVLDFFPLLPALVVAVAWGTFSALAALDVRQTLLEEGTEAYVLRSYNHAVMYVLAGALSFALPLWMTYSVTFEELWLVTSVRHDGMYPTLLDGDVVLIDRNGYEEEDPKRGEVVAIASDKPDAPVHLLRVVGAPGDTVRIEGDMLYMNDEPVEQIPFEVSEPIAGRTKAPEDVREMVERNQDTQYVISLSMRSTNQYTVTPTDLEEHQMFLLSDNRAQRPIADASAPSIRDSRDFGVIHTDEVLGRPQFIIWSRDPGDGSVRWGRIGWRVQ
ncbi:MAG: signal peptidase I [Myxococcota bacterium]